MPGSKLQELDPLESHPHPPPTTNHPKPHHPPLTTNTPPSHPPPFTSYPPANPSLQAKRPQPSTPSLNPPLHSISNRPPSQSKFNFTARREPSPLKTLTQIPFPSHLIPITHSISHSRTPPSLAHKSSHQHQRASNSPQESHILKRGRLYVPHVFTQHLLASQLYSSSLRPQPIRRSGATSARSGFTKALPQEKTTTIIIPLMPRASFSQAQRPAR